MFYNNRSHCKQPLVVALLGCITQGAHGLGDEVFLCTTVIRVTGFSLCESASAEGDPAPSSEPCAVLSKPAAAGGSGARFGGTLRSETCFNQQENSSKTRVAVPAFSP